MVIVILNSAPAKTISGVTGTPTTVRLLVSSPALTNTVLNGTPDATVMTSGIPGTTSSMTGTPTVTRAFHGFMFSISGAVAELIETPFIVLTTGTSAASLSTQLGIITLASVSSSTATLSEKSVIYSVSSSEAVQLQNSALLNDCNPLTSVSSSSATGLVKQAHLTKTLTSTSSSTANLFVNLTHLVHNVSSSAATLSRNLGVLPFKGAQVGGSIARLLAPAIVLPGLSTGIGGSSLIVGTEPLILLSPFTGTSIIDFGLTIQRRMVTIQGILLDAFGHLSIGTSISVQLNSAFDAQTSGSTNIVSFLPSGIITNGSAEYRFTLVAPQDIGTGFTYTVIFDSASANPILLTTTEFAYNENIHGLSDVVDITSTILVRVTGSVFGPTGLPLNRRVITALPVQRGVDSATGENIESSYTTLSNLSGDFNLYLPPATHVTTVDGSSPAFNVYVNSSTLYRTIAVPLLGGRIRDLTTISVLQRNKALTFDKVGPDPTPIASNVADSAAGDIVDSLARIRNSLLSMTNITDWNSLLASSIAFGVLDNINTASGDAHVTGLLTTNALQADTIDSIVLPQVGGSSPALGHIGLVAGLAAFQSGNVVSNSQGIINLYLFTPTATSGLICSIVFGSAIYNISSSLSIQLTPQDAITSLSFISGQFYATITPTGFSVFAANPIQANNTLSFTYNIEGF